MGSVFLHLLRHICQKGLGHVLEHLRISLRDIFGDVPPRVDDKFPESAARFDVLESPVDGPALDEALSVAGLEANIRTPT